MSAISLLCINCVEENILTLERKQHGDVENCA
jgi:hypothetical protein